MESEWQPARITDEKYRSQYHKFAGTGETAKFAGQIIRVRPSEEAKQSLQACYLMQLGCMCNTVLEVHPDDASRLWPDVQQPVAVCEHTVLMD